MAEKNIKKNLWQIYSSFLIDEWMVSLINFIIALIISVIFVYITNATNQAGFCFKDLLSVPQIIAILLETILIFVLINMPFFLINVSLSCMNAVESSLKRVDAHLPKLTALITNEESFEKHLTNIKKLESSSERWIYSEYISKLLYSSFVPFMIKMTALDYSNFSSKIFKETKTSIYLTGSMRPSTWLNSLVNIDKMNIARNSENIKKRTDFFNNSLEINAFKEILNRENHSLTLIKECTHLQSKNKLRVVCLDKYDVNYFFISERSIDAYYNINNPKDLPNSYFWEYPTDTAADFNPLQYEYALYDEKLLLRYDKKKEELYLISTISDGKDKKEFEGVKKFFNDQILKISSKDNEDLLDYWKIKKKIRQEKIKLLNLIIKNKKIPHKLSYLYSGGIHWNKYINDEETKYSAKAPEVIEEGLKHFKDKLFPTPNDKIEIIEIGAGSGEKISAICDTLHADKIKSYKLLDISRFLLNKSNDVLFERMPILLKNKTKEEKEKIREENIVLVDCCGNEEEKRILKGSIANKYVFIPSNSTLFTEDGFQWEDLRSSKGIFITLDLYQESQNNRTFTDHLKAKKLILYPLKIFEIPLNFENINDSFFEVKVDQNNPFIYNITFDLMRYFTDSNVQFGKLGEDEGVIAVDQCFKEYKKLREKLTKMNDLIVLSSLKFKYTTDIDTEKTIKEYFNKHKFNADIYISTCSGDRFASILLTANRND